VALKHVPLTALSFPLSVTLDQCSIFISLPLKLQTVEFLQSSTQKPEQVPDYQTVPIISLVLMGKHCYCTYTNQTIPFGYLLILLVPCNFAASSHRMCALYSYFNCIIKRPITEVPFTGFPSEQIAVNCLYSTRSNRAK